MRSTQLGTGAPRERQGIHFALAREYQWASFGDVGPTGFPSVL